MPPVNTEQLQVRPALRVLGGVAMLLIAALMVHSSIPFFSAEKISLKSCASENKLSSKFLCEIGNAMLSLLPTRMQGPAEALIHLAIAALFICLSWLLIRPLLKRSHAQSS